MEYPEDPHAPVTLNLTHQQLEAILQNVEWSLRFAALYEEGDPLEQVPLWPVIDRLYDEFSCERLPAENRPGTPDGSWVPQEELDREIESNVDLRASRRQFEALTYKLCRALGWPVERVAEFNADGSMNFARLLRAAIKQVEQERDA